MFRTHTVTEGRNGYDASPGEFFIHASSDLLRQINGIIFVHGFQQSFDQDGGGIVGQVFRDGYYLDAAVPAEHGFVEDTVLTAAGKAREFPDENQVKRPGRLLC